MSEPEKTGRVRIPARSAVPFVLLLLMTLILLVGMNPDLRGAVNSRMVATFGMERARGLYLFGYVSLLVFFGYNVVLPIWNGRWFTPNGFGDERTARTLGCASVIWSLALVGLFIMNSVYAAPFLMEIHVEILAPYLGHSKAVKVLVGIGGIMVALGVYMPEMCYRILHFTMGLPRGHEETVIEIIHNLSVVLFFIIIIAATSMVARTVVFF